MSDGSLPPSPPAENATACQDPGSAVRHRPWGPETQSTLNRLAFWSAKAYLSAMSILTAAKPKNWRPLIFCMAITLFELSMISARASQTKMPEREPWIVAAKILRNGEYSARGIYLSPGLIITAAHLTANMAATDNIRVHIANAALPATLLKQGESQDVDVALFSLDQRKLPERVQRIQMPLCQAPPWPGDPVIIVDGEHATRSHIISPHVLPFTQRIKFHTLIADVASTGNSGSGVFDPNRKCLLGIMSRKFTTIDGKDIAKYFVPAREIRDFIPIELKEKLPMK